MRRLIDKEKKCVMIKKKMTRKKTASLAAFIYAPECLKLINTV